MGKQKSKYHSCTDAELVKACMDNRRQAQLALYERFVPMMKGICLRYAASEAEAEDILQDAFIQAFKSLKRYSGQGALGGWLRRITVNKAIEQYRKNKSVQRVKDVVALKIETASSGNEVFQDLELEDLLAKIQELPLGYRTIFNLYAVEGFTHREIAEMLDISEGTSKSQFSRARNFLMNRIVTEEQQEKKRMAYE